MGLRPFGPGEWLEVDEERDAMLAEKRRLLAERPDDVVGLVEDPRGTVRAASSELLDVVLAECGRTGLPADPPEPELHPVVAAGLRVQEDWCVHVPDDRGRWVLVAACVCFPTRWVLADKLGLPVREVHRPVAGYEEQLGDPVDRFLDRLTPASPRWRLNWNLTDDPTLYQPGGKYRTEPAPLRPDDVATGVWLRVERQTLVRLPGTGAVVFGIRIHQDPLGALGDRPDDLARLAATIRSLPAGTLEHKSMGAFAPAVLAWIDGRTAQKSRNSSDSTPFSPS